MKTLNLIRYVSTPYGTLGELVMPNGLILATMEPPWRHNAKHVSCIPNGVYELDEKPSPLIERITLGKYRTALFLRDVPGRSSILLHPGNFAEDSKGCILLGMKHATINARPGIERSQIALASLAAIHAATPLQCISIKWHGSHGNIPRL